MPKSNRRPSAGSSAALVAFCVLVAALAWLKSQPQHRASPPRGAAGDSDIAAEFLARKERWGTKTGADEAAAKIDLAHPTPVTVAELASLPRLGDLPTRGGPGSDRFGDVEHTAYTIDAKLLRYKLEEEDDQDFHIVITDYKNPGVTMIVEIPDPSVVSMASPWREDIAKARQVFEDAFRPTGRFTRRSAHIRVTGVGFFDFLHGQSGVAPNGIELHPVTLIEIIG